MFPDLHEETSMIARQTYLCTVFMQKQPTV